MSFFYFKMNKKKINYVVLLILLIGTAIAIWINPDNWLESIIFLLTVGGLFKVIQRLAN